MGAADPAIDESEARAVFGPRADYYLRKWRETNRGGFNWAGFFFSGVWLAYRKMYGPAAILFTCVVVEAIVEEIVFVHSMGLPEVPKAIDRAVSLAVALICGRFGNKWYFDRVYRLVGRARAQMADQVERVRWLESRGGTTFIGAALFFGAFLAAIVVSYGLLEVLLGTEGAVDPEVL